MMSIAVPVREMSIIRLLYTERGKYFSKTIAYILDVTMNIKSISSRFFILFLFRNFVSKMRVHLRQKCQMYQLRRSEIYF